MAEFGDVIAGLEHLAPEAVSAVESFLKSKEQEFKTAMEAKYGVAPQVISDAEKTVEDATPAVAKAVEDNVPQYVKDLLERISSLETSLAQAKAGTNETTAVMGQGEPVKHTLFLEDGSVVKNHGGISTHYSVDNGDGTETVKRVIAAYPTA